MGEERYRTLQEVIDYKAEWELRREKFRQECLRYLDRNGLAYLHFTVLEEYIDKYLGGKSKE